MTRARSPLHFLLASSLSLAPLPLLQIDACGETDADQDGWTTSAGDCDDTDPQIHPEAAEHCDGLDNDCDGAIDEDFDIAGSPGICLEIDDDGDGFAENQGDCNDSSSSIHPGAADVAGDGMDQDCGGSDAPQPSVGFPGSAYPSIQSAMDAALTGETVWVGPGTYLEWSLYFKGKAITLASTHGPEATIIDANQKGHVMLFLQGETTKTVARGFTLTRGVGDSNYDGEPNGGALLIKSSSPTLEHLIMRANSAFGGGAVYVYDSSPVFRGCRIEGNTASGAGGGVYAYYLATPTFIDCTLAGNYAATQGGGFMLYRSNATVTGCTLSGNSTKGKGGGAYIDLSQPVFDNVAVTGNTADSGAGMYFNSSSGAVTHGFFSANAAGYGGGGLSTASSSPTITASIFSSNSAVSYGGAMHISSSSPTLDNVVVVDNRAATGGGLDLYGSTSAPRLVDSIFAFNSGYDLYNSGSSPVIRYSDFYASSGSSVNVSLDATNLKVNPGFLSFSADGNSSNDELHLALGSPLVNGGDPAGVDADGSRADQGAYGGEQGAGWDRDGDGVPAWFWPGTFADVPAGVNAGGYDCEDGDASIRQCND